MRWTNALNGASGTFAASNEWQAPGVLLALGDNLITVFGSYNEEDEDSDTVIITRIREYGPGSPIHYVATNGANIWPYTNWIDAAVVIQDAVDTASSNDTVRVDDGVYDMGGVAALGSDLTNRVCINRAIRLESVNGYTNTFIVGAADPSTINGPSAVRGVCLIEGATLSGFTITNGHTLAVGDQNTDRGAGGVLLDHGGTVTNCVIVGNECHGRGAGANLHHGGTIIDSILHDNHSADDAGGALIEEGSIVNCDLFKNYADGDDGGGIFYYNGGTVRNCLITGNYAKDCGGGVMFSSSAWNGLLDHCTVVSNLALFGGGVRMWRGFVRNSIIYNNTATDSDDNWSWGGNLPTIEYTCITPTNGIPGGTGCITNNPLFVAVDDYHPASNSICIDAGTNSAVNVRDLDGSPRPLDGDADGTATVDLGCYEYLNQNADSDGDAMPDGWEDEYGLNPTDPSDASAMSDSDLHNNLQEYIADTDPTDSNDYFCVVAFSNLPPMTVYFKSSSNRLYRMNSCSNLVGGVWTNVPGAGLKMGVGGGDLLNDTNDPAIGPFYRLEVQLP
jgi:hypothetical protein